MKVFQQKVYLWNDFWFLFLRRPTKAYKEPWKRTTTEDILKSPGPWHGLRLHAVGWGPDPGWCAHCSLRAQPPPPGFHQVLLEHSCAHLFTQSLLSRQKHSLAWPSQKKSANPGVDDQMLQSRRCSTISPAAHSSAEPVLDENCFSLWTKLSPTTI